jgi:STAS domain
MPTFETQIWKSARLTIERGQSETQGTIFRFYGPFTGRDMYNSLSPDAFRNIFESAPDHEQPLTHVFDLTEVPYMDSTGLGMLASHYVRIRLTGMSTVLPIAATSHES